MEYRRGAAVFASVGRFVEFEVGCDRVEAAVLQSVGRELLEQADPPAFVATQVDEDAAFLGDPFQRGVELGTALTALRRERLARQTLRMHPDQRGVTHRSGDERHVIGAGVAVEIADGTEGSEAGRIDASSALTTRPDGTTGDGNGCAAR